MILADLGAEVIKVEVPGGGDDSRGYGPFIGATSGYFASLNRNKKSVVLDLKDDRDRALLCSILAKADVLLENFKPGTLDRLGFTWPTLRSLNPRLIYCHISGFGQTGPYRDRPSYDIIAQGMGGLMSITGEPDGGPTRVGASVGDLGAALYAAVGILAALQARLTTGQGQEIDVALLDCQVALLENAVMRYATTGQSPQRIGNRHPSITPFCTVPTANGYITVAAGNDALWRRLCEVVGQPELAEDVRFATNQTRTEHWTALEPILAERFRQRTSGEWLEALQQVGIPCGPINSVEDVVNDPHVQARHMIWDYEIDGRQLYFSGNPIKFSDTPTEEVYLPPPTLGEHTEEIRRRFGG
jgi:CoA:oxalate CoA-transferase